MRWQTTAALAVILAVLGGAYYLYEIRWASEREQAEARKGRVFAVEAKDVTVVEIKRSGDTLRLERAGDGWEMTAPVKARASGNEVDGMLTTILTAKIDREIAAKPESPAEFGLDKPVADIALTLKDGRQIGLAVGATSPTGVWVYASETGKPAVFMLPDSVAREAGRPAADLRDRTILAYNRAEVTGAEIVTANAAIALEPAEAGRWKILRPVALPADSDVVTDFLDKLSNGKVKEFVAESPPSRAPYGLDRPLRVTIHTGKGKDRVSRTLLLGRADAARQGTYAMREGDSTVFLLPDDVATALPRNVAVLRNKLLVDFDRDKVTGLEIDSPRGTVILAREDDRWRIVAPRALPADQVEAGAMLVKLRGVRVVGFLTDDASGIPRYLAKPDVRVTLMQEGASPTTLLLAPSKETREGAPSAYAALAGTGPVALVEGKWIAELGRTADDLRDRALVSGLDPKAVKRVRVRVGDDVALLERTGDTEWRMLEPTKLMARAAKVEELLGMVRGLKWQEIVAPAGEEPGRYGLDAPSMEVALLKPDGAPVATVLIGKRDGDRAYVKLAAEPAIYAVDARQLGEPPKVPSDFR
ncbi:MAG TPA: DUF4340 domain-containing protein [Candidatus Limnocylindria bacterium]|nr:DUF4340 domain-containing protein [Candidatus Limnocylindria bacterium]